MRVRNRKPAVATSSPVTSTGFGEKRSTTREASADATMMVRLNGR
jgi:hypothetical protein